MAPGRLHSMGDARREGSLSCDGDRWCRASLALPRRRRTTHSVWRKFAEGPRRGCSQGCRDRRTGGHVQSAPVQAQPDARWAAHQTWMQAGLGHLSWASRTCLAHPTRRFRDPASRRRSGDPQAASRAEAAVGAGGLRCPGPNETGVPQPDRVRPAGPLVIVGDRHHAPAVLLDVSDRRQLRGVSVVRVAVLVTEDAVAGRNGLIHTVIVRPAPAPPGRWKGGYVRPCSAGGCVGEDRLETASTLGDESGVGVPVVRDAAGAHRDGPGAGARPGQLVEAQGVPVRVSRFGR